MELQGKIITINNKRFRIIYIGSYSVSLCELDTSKLIIKSLFLKLTLLYFFNYLYNRIVGGLYEKSKYWLY